MAFFAKNDYHFQLQHSDNIRVPVIQTPEELINFVIHANHQLQVTNDPGWLLITKVKQKRKGQEILYQQRIELPIQVDNGYFDGLLAGFYTKMPLPFQTESVQKLVSQPTNQLIPNEESETPKWIRNPTENAPISKLAKTFFPKAESTASKEKVGLEKENSSGPLSLQETASFVEPNVPKEPQKELEEGKTELSELMTLFEEKLETMVDHFEHRLEELTQTNMSEEQSKTEREATYAAAIQEEAERHANRLEEIDVQFYKRS